MGRATSYNKKLCIDLVEHMSSGGSFRSFGVIVGVTCRTLRNWRVKHNDFRKAYEIGREKKLFLFESLLLNFLTQDTPEARCKSRILRFFLKTQYYKVYRS